MDKIVNALNRAATNSLGSHLRQDEAHALIAELTRLRSIEARAQAVIKNEELSLVQRHTAKVILVGVET